MENVNGLQGIRKKKNCIKQRKHAMDKKASRNKTTIEKVCVHRKTLDMAQQLSSPWITIKKYPNDDPQPKVYTHSTKIDVRIFIVIKNLL